MTPLSRPSRLSRRHVLAGGLALAATTVLAACGDDTSASTALAPDDSRTPSAGPWSYTDDLDQVIELEQTPVRIAAYGDAAAALWAFGIVPVAIFTWSDPDTDPMLADVDLSELAVVGRSYGEINLEALAKAAPDLIVATTYTGDTPDSMYGFKDEEQLAKIKKIAPVVAVAQVGSAVDVIATNERLVAALGIDTADGSQVADDRAAFEAASADLTDAAASGLTVLAIHGDTDGLYYAKAPDDPALKYFQDLGVAFVDVTGKDYYWETVSWENADTYSPDLFLRTERGAFTLEQLGDQPVFAALPAVAAGQLHPWESNSMDYVSQTRYMTELAGWLRTDQDVVA